MIRELDVCIVEGEKRSLLARLTRELYNVFVASFSSSRGGKRQSYLALPLLPRGGACRVLVITHVSTWGNGKIPQRFLGIPLAFTMKPCGGFPCSNVLAIRSTISKDGNPINVQNQNHNAKLARLFCQLYIFRQQAYLHLYRYGDKPWPSIINHVCVCV